jgi:uncharacterized protein YraI
MAKSAIVNDRSRAITARLVVAAGTVFAAMLPSTVVAAERAYAISEVNLRAGPNTQFPRVTTLPAGVSVMVYGCTYEWIWCDVTWQGLRGWISGRYLESSYEGRRAYLPDYGEAIGLPTITFQFTSYWDRWYQDKPWYRERDRWYGAWMDDDWDEEPQIRSGAAAAIDLDRSSSVLAPSRDKPQGKIKKGRNFCPPGQAKKGRC